MTLALATIPDDTSTAKLVEWLEGHIVGDDLGLLAAELAALHDAEPPTESVRDRLRDRLEAVLESGLSVLTRDGISHLLRQPYHLVELQKIVLIEGLPYWDAVPRAPEFLDRVRATRERVEEALFLPLAEPAEEPVPRPDRRPDGRSNRRGVVWAVAATAAVVFVATVAGTSLLSPPGRASDTFGWARADAFPPTLDRRAYLNHLADAAEEWFAARPSDAAGAARRIAQLRNGCTALLAADHAPLTPADREWLRGRCLDWGQRIDGRLAALKEGGDAATVLADTDKTVRQVINALRDRAGSPG